MTDSADLIIVITDGAILNRSWNLLISLDFIIQYNSLLCKQIQGQESFCS